MKRPGRWATALLAGLLSSLVAPCGGCAEERRSTFDLRTPRVYVWTYLDPDRVRRSMEADGLSVEEGTGVGEGLFVVQGTGTLKWPSVEIVVRQNGIVANGVEIESRADSYRNLIVNEDGRVKPDAFLRFER